MNTQTLTAQLPNPGTFVAVEAPNHIFWFLLGGAVVITLVIFLVVRSKLKGNDKFGICFATVTFIGLGSWGAPNIMAANQTEDMMAAADAQWVSDVREWVNGTYGADATAADVRTLVNGDSANIDMRGKSSPVWIVDDEDGDLVLAIRANAGD